MDSVYVVLINIKMVIPYAIIVIHHAKHVLHILKLIA